MKRSERSKHKIAITTSSFAEFGDAPLRLLKERQIEFVMNDHKRKLEPAETVGLCSGCDGIVAGTEAYSRECLERLPGLKVISRCGVGMESIDLSAAKAMGIKVVNTPDGPTLAVAELTIGLILDILRKISMMDRGIRSYGWRKEMGRLLSGKSVGIIGYGRIGRAVGKLAASFGCGVSFCDPKVDAAGDGARKLTLAEILRGSDIVTLHVPGSDRILGATEIAMMKSGSYLVNASRGGTVDEAALLDSLKSEHVAGAALDVFEREPYKGELSKLENVVLTPHIGSYAAESRIGMETDAVRNLIKELEA